MAQAAFSDMQQIVEAGGDGTVRIGLVPSVSSLLFPLLPQTLAEAFPRLRIEFHDQTNDALIQALQRGEIDFGIGAIDSSLPAELLVYPLREDPSWRCCTATIRWPRRHICRGNSWWGGILLCSRRAISSGWWRH